MSITRKKGPLYLQVKKIIKDRILHGAYPLGTNIPSEPQLESEFNVSKMTVRNAIQELAQEGYVEKKSGVGTIVIRNTSFSKLSKGKRFTEILVEEGHKIEKQLLHAEWMENEEQDERFQLFGAQCLKIERLYVLDGKPYIHYSHYLSSAILPFRELDELAFQSLYELIEESQIDISNFKDRFTVGPAPEEVERLLQIPHGKAMFKRLRSSYDVTGTIVEYSVGHYNTELQPYLVSYDV
ncbi:GntR family transcriptional regulator [Paenibacillaceae bacterium]|nr:GntR family transcriptional regulator [Paenibacillaceae bacterium]